MCLEAQRGCLSERKIGKMEDTMMCIFSEIEIIMIMIKLMKDEGHRDNISNETDDNDSVLSAFISFPSLIIADWSDTIIESSAKISCC